MRLASLSRPVRRSQVEKALWDAIMGGTFAPGVRLIERELCERLGVSRTSIREALRRLESEKLVCNIPHKGPVVAAIAASEAAEIYTMRGLLEGFAAREFARLAGNNAIARFGAAAKELRAQAAAQNREGVLRAKTDLYNVLLAHCGNALIKDALLSLHGRIRMLRNTSLMHPDRLAISVTEIDELYTRIKVRDEDGAELAARAHVANARDATLRVLLNGSAEADKKAG